MCPPTTSTSSPRQKASSAALFGGLVKETNRCPSEASVPQARSSPRAPSDFAGSAPRPTSSLCTLRIPFAYLLHFSPADLPSPSLACSLEKESAFEAVVHDPRFQSLCASWLVVTGKGYPDHATRGLLRRLLDANEDRQPPLGVHIVTDADPHGASIAVCYARALSNIAVHWSGVHPSHRDVFFRIPIAAKIALTNRERAMAMQLLAECKANSAQFPRFCADIARGLKDMLESNVKFEIEAIEALEGANDGNSLVEYLLAVLYAPAS